MRLESIRVNNFRCLLMNEPITFEPDVTVIVGENDTGKSSLVEIIKMVIGNKDLPDQGDFFRGENIIKCELDFGEEFYSVEFINEEGNIKKNIKRVASWAKLKDYLMNEEKIDQIESVDEIKEILAQYGADSKKRAIDSLRQELREHLQNNKSKIMNNEKGEVEVKEIPPILQVHLLGGQDFDDIDKFVKDVYLKDALNNIWNWKIEGTGKELVDILEGSIRKVEEEKQEEVNSEVLPQIKEFFESLQEITLDVQYTPYDIARNINVVTNFKDVNNNEIQFSKKGDGTKRRTTMALLRHKVEKEKGAGAKLFLFDEPDTHLHVRAQHDLMEIIDEIAHDDQVIITTHSPFLLNSVEPSKNRLFHSDNGVVKVKCLDEDNGEIKELLHYLGIKNTHLFFTRKILLVEGESEMEAIPLLFKKYKKKSLDSELITLIDAGGVDGLAHLAKVIDDLMSDIPLFALVDADINRRQKTNKLLERLSECEAVKRIKIGYKEFEDAFEDSVIYEAVKQYNEDEDGELKETWTMEGIREGRDSLNKNAKYDFSGKLEKLSGISKVKIAKSLARYCSIEQIPDELIELFDSIKPE